MCRAQVEKLHLNGYFKFKEAVSIALLGNAADILPELVRDRDSKAPFDPALRLHAQVKKQAMARGLMVYPMGGTVNGCDGDHVLLAPPFIASDAELARIAQLLAEAIAASIP